ncbi:MAG TPA: CPBP family intramembrane glutamic endopeptidase [Terriglobales bacterium]|nr:CPBP family intramembrane glutamic endopeptidase [Terriglobales bacterium]
MSRSSKARVLIFVLLVALFTAVIQVLNSRHKLGGIGSLVFMWCPAMAALVASVITRRSLKVIGWSPRKVQWIAAGWALPILYSFVAYGSIWLFGLGGFPNPRFLQRAPLAMNLAPGHSPTYIIVTAFFFISVYLLIPSMISAIGEEIGWRGFLVPELNNILGFRGAALLSGAIWAAWHLPAIVFGGYGVEGTPKLYQVACFAAMVISSAVLMAWLRMRSGSIWPCVVLHATHNAVIQLFFDAITANTGRTAYFAGEFGIALVIPQATLAWYLLRKPSHAAERNIIPIDPAPTLA